MGSVRREAHQFRGTVNGDASLDTNGFAQLATNALFLVNHGDTEKFGMISAGLHGDTVERTDVDAELAGRTGFRIDFGFRDGQRLDLLDRLAFGVNDGLDRAMDAANTAIDAEGRIDMERGLLDARNGLGRTFHFAKGAADAGAKNGVWHGNPFQR
jgi:hypothetical protein